MKSWKKLKQENRIKDHKTSAEEVISLLAVVKRDLSDARLKGLSDDRRFATAYNAALQLCKLVIACSGYRVSGLGHHQVTFEAAQIALKEKGESYCDYFEICRRKRNVLDYDMAGVVTEVEAGELLLKTSEFSEIVETWLNTNFPHYLES